MWNQGGNDFIATVLIGDDRTLKVERIISVTRLRLFVNHH